MSSHLQWVSTHLSISKILRPDDLDLAKEALVDPGVLYRESEGRFGKVYVPWYDIDKALGRTSQLYQALMPAVSSLCVSRRFLHMGDTPFLTMEDR